MIDKILNRLPSHFNKSKDSNNYKALSLLANAIDDNKKLYDTILKFWDVDQAAGYGLDQLGKDEGISRGSYNDRTFRKMIKIQFVVNMSTGDIESINTILRAYMGSNFLGLEEGWNSYLKEPASVIFNVSKNAEHIPLSLTERIKAAGVGIYFAAVIDSIVGIIQSKGYTFPVPYRITGTFHTAPTNGIASKTAVELKPKTYANLVPYPITGAFYCSEGGY